MTVFSERQGYIQVRKVIQRISADNTLRTDLWNHLCKSFFLTDNRIYLKEVLQDIWANYLHRRLDLFEATSAYNYISEEFFKKEWYVMFDLLEIIPLHYSNLISDISDIRMFRNNVNKALEKNLSAYRFVNELITEITAEEEITSIEESFNNLDSTFSSTRTHLNQALKLLAKRTAPDYKNSIKESINAVRTLACKITNKPEATLSEAIQTIDAKEKIPASIKVAFEKLFIYTFDGNGINHKLLSLSNFKQEDAKFILVASSALINYLVAKTQGE